MRSPISYMVCPKCQNMMVTISNKWVCKVCGYTYKHLTRRSTRNKLKEIAKHRVV